METSLKTSEKYKDGLPLQIVTSNLNTENKIDNRSQNVNTISILQDSDSISKEILAKTEQLSKARSTGSHCSKKFAQLEYSSWNSNNHISPSVQSSSASIPHSALVAASTLLKNGSGSSFNNSITISNNRVPILNDILSTPIQTTKETQPLNENHNASRRSSLSGPFGIFRIESITGKQRRISTIASQWMTSLQFGNSKTMEEEEENENEIEISNPSDVDGRESVNEFQNTNWLASGSNSLSEKNSERILSLEKKISGSNNSKSIFKICSPNTTGENMSQNNIESSHIINITDYLTQNLRDSQVEIFGQNIPKNPILLSLLKDNINMKKKGSKTLKPSESHSNTTGDLNINFFGKFEATNDNMPHPIKSVSSSPYTSTHISESISEFQNNGGKRIKRFYSTSEQFNPNDNRFSNLKNHRGSTQSGNGIQNSIICTENVFLESKTLAIEEVPILLNEKNSSEPHCVDETEIKKEYEFNTPRKQEQKDSKIESELVPLQDSIRISLCSLNSIRNLSNDVSESAQAALKKPSIPPGKILVSINPGVSQSRPEESRVEGSLERRRMENQLKGSNIGLQPFASTVEILTSAWSMASAEQITPLRSEIHIEENEKTFQASRTSSQNHVKSVKSVENYLKDESNISKSHLHKSNSQDSGAKNNSDFGSRISVIKRSTLDRLSRKRSEILSDDSISPDSVCFQNAERKTKADPSKKPQRVMEGQMKKPPKTLYEAFLNPIKEVPATKWDLKFHPQKLENAYQFSLEFLIMFILAVISSLEKLWKAYHSYAIYCWIFIMGFSNIIRNVLFIYLTATPKNPCVAYNVLSYVSIVTLLFPVSFLRVISINFGFTIITIILECILLPPRGVNSAQIGANFIVYLTSNIVVAYFSYVSEIYQRRSFMKVRITFSNQEKLTAAREQSEILLQMILPKKVIETLRKMDFNNAKRRINDTFMELRGVTVMFADIVGFTEFSSSVKADYL
ncbi:hypothetical protein HK096_010377, partial [Nowakowskiella sp. JEL0078]